MALDPESYPIATDLELQQVHVYVRHGERTPVGIRMTGPPANIPKHWLLCNAGRRFKAAVSGTVDGGKGSLRVHRVVEGRDGASSEGKCMGGELTDLGRQSTYRYGQSLRKIYVEKLEFLPDIMAQNELAYFRSTNVPRTIESLQEVVQGLYPSSKTKPGIASKIFVRTGMEENLVDNTSACKRLKTLYAEFAKAAAERFNPLLAPLDKTLSKYDDSNPIRVDGRPRVSGLLDTVRAAKAHGIAVPREFEDQNVMSLLEQAVAAEWVGGYSNEEYRRLAMGPLLDDVQRKMQYKVNNPAANPLKILVHATHDTTLAGICKTLDVWDQSWPDFTSSITFELFRKPTTSNSFGSEQNTNQPQQQQGTQSFIGSMYGTFSSLLYRKGSIPPTNEYYVRMRYQNKDMVLPHCSPSGKHLSGRPEYCTLSAFQERVKELTPVDWELECASSGPTLTSNK